MDKTDRVTIGTKTVDARSGGYELIEAHTPAN